MAMSTHVKGFRPPDEDWEAMKRVWDACKEAGVEIPEAVEHFFNGEEPDEQGVAVDLPDGVVAEYRDHDASGYEIYLDQVPDGIKVIRFWNSW